MSDERLRRYVEADEAQNAALKAKLAPWADVHSVLCYAHRVPHGHGIACHSTCPTCHGEARWVDLFGIDPDYTEGKPVDEWLREQRGEA